MRGLTSIRNTVTKAEIEAFVTIEIFPNAEGGERRAEAEKR